ncbi:thioesterase II family protein [Amycolatopsis sp. NPDC049868]|uniref:thioesterase II family protein n=1 Tax=Amycolatopsis sp. NPDC049868 TaxID=3363934 RepID=UPI0037B2F9B5
MPVSGQDNGQDSSRWIRRYQPWDGAPFRIVCFPHAGGSASYFFPMAKALSSAADVLAVQYPGRQDRRSERCLESITELADEAAEALLPWLDRPTVLFGHSMGATLGFEVARRLEANGATELRALFASGRVAPSRARDERVHQEPDDNRFLEAVESLGGTNAQVFGDDDLLRMVLPVLRADYRAAETYRCPPGTVLEIPIHVLLGEDDPKVTVEEAESWRDHTTASCTLTTYPGGHFYLSAQAPKVVRTIVDVLTPTGGTLARTL